MNVKIGDKVRIKTEEELLADGWEPGFDNNGVLQFFTTPDDLPGWSLVWKSACGEIIRITDIDGEEVYYGSGCISLDVLAEKVPPTLDEYICGLPLEVRATYFVKELFCDDNIVKFGSTITGEMYESNSQAIQATIEALKQTKEN